MNKSFVRLLDITLALVGILTLSPIALILYCLGYLDNRSPIFIQERVGLNQRPFRLFKFRTMPINTKSVATHLAEKVPLSRFGQFLRKSKLDELPQLINILKGEMSFVGPRPCLFNQIELINARQRKQVFSVRPGITGLAQINNIDMSQPKYLAEIDRKMITEFTIKHYFLFILKTLIGNGQGDNLSFK